MEEKIECRKSQPTYVKRGCPENLRETLYSELVGTIECEGEKWG